MTRDTSSLITELIGVLDAAAMYGDKGYIWSGHDAAKRAEIETSFHERMLELLHRIGGDSLAPELVQAIVSGAAARDDLGYFSDLARRS